MAGRAGRAVAVVLGVILSVAAVGLAFFKPVLVDDRLRLVPRFALGDWLHDLPSHLPWLATFVLLSATLPALRALVWGYTAPAPAPGYGTRYHAIALGGLVHNTLPGRLGVLASAYFIARRTGRPVVESLFSLLVAKVLELGALVGASAALLPAVAAQRGGSDPGLARTGLVGLILLGCSVALLSGLAAGAPAIAAALDRRGRLPRLASGLQALSAGVRGVGSVRRLGLGLVAALAPVAAGGLAYGLPLAHAGAAGGVLGGWPLLAAITLGQLTPGLPVGTGVYVLVCAWGARALGVDAADAAAIAVLTHIGSVLANLGVGLASAARNRREIRGFLAFRRGTPAGPAPLAASGASQS